ncbi:hypothetical protein ACQPW1_30310 [Nocardia sp. CA-128927]|uniref:hypothetical protein n=1 Tax=Nocardia sp. CA-128927 TaxID=3239975 RepID=UPI003D97793B
MVSLSALHYEVPNSDISETVELNDVAILDGHVPVIDRRLMLDPCGSVGSQHTLRCTVFAINPGLWEGRTPHHVLLGPNAGGGAHRTI